MPSGYNTSQSYAGKKIEWVEEWKGRREEVLASLTGTFFSEKAFSFL